MAPTLIQAAALGCMIVPAGAAGQEPTRGASDQQARTMKIRVNIEGTAIAATLLDTATARDFASLLPLTLTLKDYAATEKISDLPRRLSTEGAPPGSAPSVGDVAYYSPWGNLALFYKDSGYASGLVKLGKLDSGVEALHRPDPVTVTIELVGK
jgi:hypothetical protein